MKFTTAAVASAAIAVAQATTVEPIVKKGSKFFFKNGTQFFFKGVAYQQDVGAGGSSSDDSTSSYVDPLSNVTLCERDIPYLQELGTNVIRTYAIDPTADHSGCMKLLQEAGIYVVSDLSEPDDAIDRSDPAWDTTLFTRYKNVVDELAQYENVIGFFAGNEVTNDINNTEASAFVKAAVRDTKAYINSTQDRWLGVGYATNDDATIRSNLADYFNCGETADSVDFWGYNIYSWCGESTMAESGYTDRVDFFKNYSVPVFWAEYGCNSNTAADRIFEETTAIYSSEMTDVISGGIVYMYFEETNDYGLVTIVDDAVSKMKDFTSLSSRIAAVDPTSTSSADYTPTNSAQACPAVGSDWAASSDLPPTPDTDLCECMYDSLTCVPASGLATSKYADIYSYVCGLTGNLCAGMEANGTTGVYGAYSMCTSKQKLAYVMNQYYLDQDSDSSACSFSGDATTQAAATASSCSASLASASSVNAVAATATAGDGENLTGSAADSSSSSSSSSSSDSFGNPAAAIGHFTIANFAIGAYMVAAFAAGAGMVLL